MRVDVRTHSMNIKILKDNCEQGTLFVRGTNTISENTFGFPVYSTVFSLSYSMVFLGRGIHLQLAVFRPMSFSPRSLTSFYAVDCCGYDYGWNFVVFYILSRDSYAALVLKKIVSYHIKLMYWIKFGTLFCTRSL